MKEYKKSGTDHVCTIRRFPPALERIAADDLVAPVSIVREKSTSSSPHPSFCFPWEGCFSHATFARHATTDGQPLNSPPSEGGGRGVPLSPVPSKLRSFQRRRRLFILITSRSFGHRRCVSDSTYSHPRARLNNDIASLTEWERRLSYLLNET
ncbi:hypothetical protein TNCV_730631 [Trichonephila clavipes]|nr:hypothetical protein TNCV_730631 [Trichonephila clavipes]